MMREGMKERKERLKMEKEVQNKERFKEMLNIKVNRPAMESKVDILEYPTTTTRSMETDEMTSGWYLTNRSPSHCNESYLILGGEMRIDSGETECGTGFTR